MGLIKRIKNIENKISINKGKYKFNKWVFNIMVLLMIIIVLLVWAEYDFEDIRKPHIFLECKYPNAICENDFYDLCNPSSYEFVGVQDICYDVGHEFYANEFLYTGESIGHKPSLLAESALTFFGLLLMLAFFVNHIIQKSKVYKR